MWLLHLNAANYYHTGRIITSCNSRGRRRTQPVCCHPKHHTGEQRHGFRGRIHHGVSHPSPSFWDATCKKLASVFTAVYLTNSIAASPAALSTELTPGSRHHADESPHYPSYHMPSQISNIDRISVSTSTNGVPTPGAEYQLLMPHPTSATPIQMPSIVQNKHTSITPAANPLPLPVSMPVNIPPGFVQDPPASDSPPFQPGAASPTSTSSPNSYATLHPLTATLATLNTSVADAIPPAYVSNISQVLAESDADSNPPSSESSISHVLDVTDTSALPLPHQHETTPSWWAETAPDWLELHSAADLAQLLAASDRRQHRLIAVEFYTRGCPVCASKSHELHEVVADEAMRARCKFARVDVEADPDFFQSLGVKHVPTMFVYSPEGYKLIDFIASGDSIRDAITTLAPTFSGPVPIPASYQADIANLPEPHLPPMPELEGLEAEEKLDVQLQLERLEAAEKLNLQLQLERLEAAEKLDVQLQLERLEAAEKLNVQLQLQRLEAVKKLDGAAAAAAG